MIRKVSFAALAVLSCTAAVAAPDKRIRTEAFSADHIVQLIAKEGIQSTIQFAPDERIQNVAIGDSSKWEITPNRGATLIFVKPLAPRSRTNMTVVTDRRTYMFDLVAGDKFTIPVYALKFSYPNEKPVPDEAKAEQPVQQVAPATQAPATMTADKLHFDWKSKGSGKLVPSRVFDDGAAVYLAWNKDVPLPAILTMSEDRKEGPLSYKMSGDYIVVSPIPQNMVLRYGDRMALLWTTRRIVQPQPQQRQPASSQVAERMAAAAVVSAPTQPVAPAGAPSTSAVKVANMTSLYTDKLTDGRQ